MRPLVLIFVGVTALVVATPPARAGCSDGACGRVDWTEVTAVNGAQPTAAKLHGRFAWESSNAWGDSHPVGGKLNGFLWMACDEGDSPCRTLLAAELAKSGTTQPLYFGGSFYDYDKQRPVQPAVLFAEGVIGAPTPLAAHNLGFQPFNGEVCPTAFALPGPLAADAGPGGGADASVAGAPDATPNIQGTPDDSACAVGFGGGSGAGAGSVLLLVLVLIARRRRV